MKHPWQDYIREQCGEEFYVHYGIKTACYKLCKEHMRHWDKTNCHNHCGKTYQCLETSRIASLVLNSTKMNGASHDNPKDISHSAESTLLLSWLVGILLSLGIFTGLVFLLIKLRRRWVQARKKKEAQPIELETILPQTATRDTNHSRSGSNNADDPEGGRQHNQRNGVPVHDVRQTSATEVETGEDQDRRDASGTQRALSKVTVGSRRDRQETSGMQQAREGTGHAANGGHQSGETQGFRQGVSGKHTTVAQGTSGTQERSEDTTETTTAFQDTCETHKGRHQSINEIQRISQTTIETVADHQGSSGIQQRFQDQCGTTGGRQGDRGAHQSHQGTSRIKEGCRGNIETPRVHQRIIRNNRAAEETSETQEDREDTVEARKTQVVRRSTSKTQRGQADAAMKEDLQNDSETLRGRQSDSETQGGRQGSNGRDESHQDNSGTDYKRLYENSALGSRMDQDETDPKRAIEIPNSAPNAKQCSSEPGGDSQVGHSECSGAGNAGSMTQPPELPQTDWNDRLPTEETQRKSVYAEDDINTSTEMVSQGPSGDSTHQLLGTYRKYPYNIRPSDVRNVYPETEPPSSIFGTEAVDSGNGSKLVPT